MYNRAPGSTAVPHKQTQALDSIAAYYITDTNEKQEFPAYGHDNLCEVDACSTVSSVPGIKYCIDEVKVISSSNCKEDLVLLFVLLVLARPSPRAALNILNTDPTV